MAEKKYKPEEIMKFNIPEVEEEEVYLLRDKKTGKIIARTKKELDEMEVEE